MDMVTRLVWTAPVLVGLLFVTDVSAESPEPPFTGVTAGDNLNVRAGAGDNYYVVLQLDRGELVEVHDELFGWYQIVPPENSFSYISKAFVNARGDGRTGVVNANRVRVRAPSPAGPSKSYRTQVTVDDGAEVTILEEEDGYYRIAPPEDAYLFVSSEYVEAASEAQIAEARGEAIEPVSSPEPEESAEEPAPEAEAMTEEDEPAEEAASETSDEPEAEAEAAATEPEMEADEAAESEAEQETDTEEPSEPEAEDEPEPLESAIAVLSDGSVSYRGEAIEGDPLREKLVAISEEFGELTIEASPDAPSREVFAALDKARAAGIGDVRVSSRRSTPEPDEPAEVAEAESTAEEVSEQAMEQPSLSDELETVPGQEPVVLEQDLEQVEAEPDEPLTFDELERRYEQVSQMPLRQQPIGELRMDYEHLRVTGDLSERDRRLADVRIEVLSMRQELQASLMQVSAVEEETREAERRRAEEDAARPRDYAAVGRLTTSTLYTGERLPLLYRVVDPLSGRTVAYVQPGEVDPINLIGKYVGVEGRRDFDGTLGLYVVTAENIDELTAQGERRPEGEGSGQ